MISTAQLVVALVLGAVALVVVAWRERRIQSWPTTQGEVLGWSELRHRRRPSPVYKARLRFDTSSGPREAEVVVRGVPESPFPISYNPSNPSEVVAEAGRRTPAVSSAAALLLLVLAVFLFLR